MFVQEKIWYNDPFNIINKHNYLKFFPSSNMSFEQKLNSIMRFAIYLTILMFLLKNDPRTIYILFIVAFITFLMHITFVKNLSKTISPNTVTDTFTNTKCIKPSSDNPFMNPLVTDLAPNSQWNNEQLNACNVQDEDVKQDMFNKYNEKLFRGVDDIFMNGTGDRQFYTVPNTDIIPNQEGFAQWLYGGSNFNCKSGNSQACYDNVSQVILSQS